MPARSLILDCLEFPVEFCHLGRMRNLIRADIIGKVLRQLTQARGRPPELRKFLR